MNDATTKSPYRDFIEDLAQSRGFSGAEELVERAAAAEPKRVYSARALLEDPPAGFGLVLDRVLDPPLSEQEKGQLSRAFGETFWRSLR